MPPLADSLAEKLTILPAHLAQPQVKQVWHIGQAMAKLVQFIDPMALVPLSLWFVASLAWLAGADHARVVDWVDSPLVASLLVLLVVATLYHAYLGLQVVIEDYVHHEGAKMVWLIGVKGACLLLGVIGVLSVLVLLLGNGGA